MNEMAGKSLAPYLEPPIKDRGRKSGLFFTREHTREHCPKTAGGGPAGRMREKPK